MAAAASVIKVQDIGPSDVGVIGMASVPMLAGVGYGMVRPGRLPEAGEDFRPWCLDSGVTSCRSRWLPLGLARLRRPAATWSGEPCRHRGRAVPDVVRAARPVVHRAFVRDDRRGDKRHHDRTRAIFRRLQRRQLDAGDPPGIMVAAADPSATRGRIRAVSDQRDSTAADAGALCDRCRGRGRGRDAGRFLHGQLTADSSASSAAGSATEKRP